MTRSIRSASGYAAARADYFGHVAQASHLANIAYRVGHSLNFDGKTETFKDDKKADGYLTREYRKGFEIPKSFS